MSAENNILSIKNIEVIYDHVILVLKGVSLDVPKGGIVALLGANGAGKTTTIKSISNILKTERGEVTKGSIAFEGEQIENLSPTELVKRGVVSRFGKSIRILSTPQRTPQKPGRVHLWRRATNDCSWSRPHGKTQINPTRRALDGTCSSVG